MTFWAGPLLSLFFRGSQLSPLFPISSLPIPQRPLRLCVIFLLLFRGAAMATSRSRAVRAGTLGKNNCFAPQQSRAGSVSYIDDSFSPRARTRDGAVDILPARLRRQENRKSRTRATQSLSAKCLAAHGATSPLVSCSGWLPTVLDGSWPARGFHPRRYSRRRAARSGPAAAP